MNKKQLRCINRHGSQLHEFITKKKLEFKNDDNEEKPKTRAGHLHTYTNIMGI